MRNKAKAKLGGETIESLYWRLRFALMQLRQKRNTKIKKYTEYYD